jgi:Protein of unknown function (DUF2809)
MKTHSSLLPKVDNTNNVEVRRRLVAKMPISSTGPAAKSALRSTAPSYTVEERFPYRRWTDLLVTMLRRRRIPLVRMTMIALVSALGIGSRHYAQALPEFIAAYAGDTLWALAAFLAFGLVLPRQSTWTVAVLAIAFSVLIEVSQLYHAPWIDSIRQTTLGGLILGFGFLWSDLACYAAGVGLGDILELIFLAVRNPRRS